MTTYRTGSIGLAVVAAAALGLWLAAPGAQAATQWWDVSTNSGLTAGNGNWSTSASDTNWSTAAAGTVLVPWTNGNDAVFLTAGPSVITVNGSIFANTATFSGQGPWTLLGSGPLTVSNGMTMNYSLTNFVPITLAGNQTWTITGSRVVSNLAVLSETGGSRALTLDNVSGTQAGTLVTTNSNTFSGGFTILNGIYSSLGGGSGLGSGAVTLGTPPFSGQRGVANISFDTVTAGNTTATMSNLTVAGMGVLTLKTSVTGSTNILNAQALSRQGRATLEIIPGNSLGVREQATFTGGMNLINSMLPPWIADSKGASFVTYGANGLADTTYDVTNTAVAWDNTKKVLISNATTLSGNANAYAMKLGAALTLNGMTLTLGNGSGQAGLCLNGQSLLGSGTLAFGGAEGMIYAYANNPLIATAITGTGGVTIFGGGGGGYNLTISNNQPVLDVGPITVYLNGSTSSGLKIDTTPCDKTIVNPFYSYVSGLFKFGPNTLTLSGATNLVGGNFTVNAGTVTIQGQVAELDGTLTVTGGSTLNIQTNVSTVGGAVAVGSGSTLSFVSASNNCGNTITINSGGTLQFLNSTSFVS